MPVDASADNSNAQVPAVAQKGEKKKMLPLLYIPGILSSGLEVQKSGISDKHIGERVWFNPMALGLGALYFGNAMQQQQQHHFPDHFRLKKEAKDDSTVTPDSSAEEVLDPKNLTKAEEAHNTRLVCKSSWLQHMSLDEDMVSERPGNEIRPIPGLDGVDFLTEIAMHKVGFSYVFGPIIKVLQKAGMIPQKHFDAAPYDWRIPPSVLEERDGYFTATMKRIEDLYESSDNTPIVLLCHSMGVKCGHYLLNFALKHRGREWLDKYIHTFMPLGGPHLGAPSTVSSLFSGEMNPILDAMLSLEEKLVLMRSFGSGPWIIPNSIPERALPALFVRNEGALEVTIRHPIGDCHDLVKNKYGTRDIPGVRLYVEYGEKKTKSRYTTPQEDKGFFEFNETFVFATPPTLEQGLELLKLSIQEPGSMKAHDREKNATSVEILKMLSPYYRRQIYLNETTTATDTAYSKLGISDHFTIDTKTLLESEGHEMDIPIKIYARVDTTYWGYKAKEGARFIETTAHVRWIPPVSMRADTTNAPIANLPEKPMTLPLQCTNEGNEGAVNSVTYNPVCGREVLHEGMGDRIFQLTRDRYDLDPLGPRTASAVDAPPVKRVYAIHGINVPTAVSGVLRRAPALAVKQGKMKAHFTADKFADLPKDIDTYKVKNGQVWETRDTPQKHLKTGETIKCCGDGTVPYWSLQQPQTWSSPDCEVLIKEIDGAEHRAILNDKRFHDVLLAYLGVS